MKMFPAFQSEYLLPLALFGSHSDLSRKGTDLGHTVSSICFGLVISSRVGVIVHVFYTIKIRLLVIRYSLYLVIKDLASDSFSLPWSEKW